MLTIVSICGTHSATAVLLGQRLVDVRDFLKLSVFDAPEGDGRGWTKDGVLGALGVLGGNRGPGSEPTGGSRGR